MNKNIYIEYIMTKLMNGGRRTRRVNAWAKAAGEYYRSHKNDPDIQAFSDVLKSPKFKAYYQSKYGNKSKSSSPSFKSTRRASRGRFGRTRRSNKYKKNEDEDMEENMDEDMDEDMDENMDENMDKNMDENMDERPYKGKKGKKGKKASSDDWSWGWESDKKGKNEGQRFKKNEYLNGGKKGGNQQQEQQQEQQKEQQQQQE
jgi:hypothetical protein